MFIPALLTNISTFLSFKINEKSSNELSSRKSTLKNSAPLRESVTSFVPVAITCISFLRNLRAIARPIPLVAPVQLQYIFFYSFLFLKIRIFIKL